MSTTQARNTAPLRPSGIHDDKTNLGIKQGQEKGEHLGHEQGPNKLLPGGLPGGLVGKENFGMADLADGGIAADVKEGVKRWNPLGPQTGDQRLGRDRDDNPNPDLPGDIRGRSDAKKPFDPAQGDAPNPDLPGDIRGRSDAKKPLEPVQGQRGDLPGLGKPDPDLSSDVKGASRRSGDQAGSEAAQSVGTNAMPAAGGPIGAGMSGGAAGANAL